MSGTIAVVTGMMVVISACGTSVSTVQAKAAVPRASTIGVSGDPAAQAIDELGVDLYKRLAGTPGNLVFSPYSIVMVLAMARNGAIGETRSQMDTVLHAGSGDEIDKALNLLDQQLAQRSGHRGDAQRSGNIALATANALWGQKDGVFEKMFLDVLAAQYGAGMELVDYRSNAEAARRSINGWASDLTKGRIVDLLPPGSLDEATRLVLANAIYFKAPWAKRFSTLGDMPFMKADGSTVVAPAMTSSGTGTYSEGVGWRAAEIPYLGGELSMVVILPDDLAGFERTLDQPVLSSILTGAKEQLASVQMPKFTFRSAVPLKEQLSALGMPRAFSDAAQFSGITKVESLKIKDVFHQAFIAVDEEGTEAAAATAAVFVPVSGPMGKSLVVDRPFLFAIRDTKTGAVLFLGRVTDPTNRAA